MRYSLHLLGQSRFYWLFVLTGALLVEAIALYYQYFLDEPPCVLCIHVRLWIALIALLALVFVSLPKTPGFISHSLMALTGAAMIERSWQLLGNERGFIIGSCGFDTGLPSWFAPDRWFPLLFEIQTTCGYTPEVVFGITMAEALLAGSVVFTLFCVAMVIMSIRAR